MIKFVPQRFHLDIILNLKKIHKRNLWILLRFISSTIEKMTFGFQFEQVLKILTIMIISL